MKHLRKKWCVAVSLVTVVALLGIALLLPGLIETRMNRISGEPPPEPSEPAIDLHRQLFIADLHADTLLWNRDLLVRGTRGHVDLPRLIEGNVALQAFTVVTQTPRNLNYENNSASSDNVTLLAIAQRWPPSTWTSLRERALYQSGRLHDAVARSNGRLRLIRSQKDLAEFIQQRNTGNDVVGCILGIEGLHCLEGDVENIDTFFNAGFRMMGPAHFFDNQVGGSAHGVAKGGLTEFGEEVIKMMEERMILIDLAHASPQLIDEVLKIVTRPVVSSHTGVKGICDRERNLSDEHLRGIAATGGVVGIGYWNEAVCGRDVSSIAGAIVYAIGVVGADHVALGSDFDGAVSVPFDASRVIAVTDALLRAGLSTEDITKVMGGNIRKLLTQVLPPG